MNQVKINTNSQFDSKNKNSKYCNPLLEWADEYIISSNDKKYFSPNYWLLADLNLCKKIRKKTGIKIDYKYTEDYMENHPECFARSNIASSLLNESNYEELINFSNGYIWSHGCGTGYHESRLVLKGCNIYATDQNSKKKWFKYSFMEIDASINENKVKKIIKNNGVLLYIWPWRQFYDLEVWLRNGGKKIVIIGDFNKDHFSIFNVKNEKKQKIIDDLFKKLRIDGSYSKEELSAIIKKKKLNIDMDKVEKDIDDVELTKEELNQIKTICPIFSLDGWELTNKMNVPQYNSVNDYIQFWEKID